MFSTFFLHIGGIAIFIFKEVRKMNEKNKRAKKQSKEKKYYIRGDITVPFGIKRALLVLGMHMDPLEERTGSQIWYAYDEETRNNAEKLICNYGMARDKERIIEEDAPRKKNTSLEIILDDFEEKVEKDGNYNWDSLLLPQNWDTLKAVQAIKEHGLPKIKEQRETLLSYLARSNPGKQYNVVYEDLCEYCEDFEEAYGWDKIREALIEANITNGFNLPRKVRSSELPLEMQNAILYAFPAVHRERAEIRFDEESDIEVALDKLKKKNKKSDNTGSGQNDDLEECERILLPITKKKKEKAIKEDKEDAVKICNNDYDMELI